VRLRLGILAALVLVAFGFLLLRRGSAVIPGQTLTRRDTLRILNAAERDRVQGRGSVNRKGEFGARIYNGSDCTLTRLIYRLVPRDGQPAMVRDYSKPVLILPRMSQDVELQPDSVGRWRSLPRWFVDSVEGRCASPADRDSVR
jgi:hypothetical protein